MAATLRRIDLFTNLLAPVMTGQIVGNTSTFVGAIVIGGWNLVSLVFELIFQSFVYRSVPELAVKFVEEQKQSSIKHKILAPIFALIGGWKAYIKQSCAYAGIALSFLYLTVIGFGNITTGK